MDIDTSALEGAFQIDESQLDLSGIMNINLEEILPEVSEDLKQEAEDLSQRLDLEISEEELRAMTEDMIRGFQESLPEDSDIKFTDPAQSFQDYLETEEARKILEESIRNLVLSNISVSLSTDQLWGIAAQLVTDYQNYAKENNIEESSVATIIAYLQLPQVQQNLTAQAENVIRDSIDIQIPPDQIQQIFAALLAGYQEYAAEYVLPDAGGCGDRLI